MKLKLKKSNNKIVGMTVMVFAVFLLIGCGDNKVVHVLSQDEQDIQKNRGKIESDAEETLDESDMDLLSGLHHIEIEIENYGTVKLELNADQAPITTTNFMHLVSEGFYDGLTFHRIIEGFMIQGGDPLGNGTGGSSQSIKGEFASNGIDNSLSNVRGAIAMARSQNPDSASSQFYIVQQDSAFLDGDYAVFGSVTEGMEYVDAICREITVEDGNGTVKEENQPKIKSIKVLD